jgi:transcriptional regulator with XRE-family HTH domain
MKRLQPNQAVRALRKTIGLTQAEFAAMIGVSKDAVVSWEIGRNELSATFARRIALVTGVDGRTLRLGISVPFSQAEDCHEYTKADFERHQRTEWSGSDEAQAERLARCQDTLELLFRAAARPEGEPPRQRLPAVMDSFMQWCRSAREDFKLGPAIDEQLAQRRFRAGMTQEYRLWRAMARGNPEGLKAAGFTDDPSRGDKEELRLELELVPGWAPGRSMKPPRPAIMILAPNPAPAAGAPETIG